MNKTYFCFGSITVIALCATSIAQAPDGAKLFKANCVLCHSSDGSGDSPTGKALKAKDLRSPEVQKETDETLTEIITKGKGKMSGFGAKLKPDDIKALVGYVRSIAKK